ncbi:MAG: SDR family oxidoreductase [Methylovirgula sp.]
MVFYVDLTGKRVLVTGASSGIGRRTATDLAKRGAILVLSGRDAERLEATRQDLEPGDHIAITAELKNPSEIATLVAACGQIDGVVHSAGRSGPMPWKQLSEKFLDEILTTNFKSAILLTQQLLGKSRIKEGASIVFLSSIAAHTGTRGMGSYSASKGALLSFMRAAALELAPKKIRINSVSPAMVRTEIWAADQAKWLDEQEKRYPLGLGKPEDVSNAIIFLLSDASKYMTGTTVIMDGGCTFI